MKIYQKQSGFTLVEVIVVAAIVAILAGVLIPLILKEIDEARISRAYADVRAISSSIIVMKKDTGKWPDLNVNCSPAVTFLKGDGNLPAKLADFSFDETSTVELNQYLEVDINGCYGAKWKGPYLAWTNADPWGNAYVIGAQNFEVTGPVWIISAGPNGEMNTFSTGETIQGDDVGIRLK